MRRPATIRAPEPDPFPFTEEELFLALRLVSGEEEARQQAREMTTALASEPLWDAPDESLALLALGSASAAAKVDAIRQQRVPDRDTWVRVEMHRAGLPVDGPPPNWLVERWNEDNASRERTWNEAVSRMRNELVAQGKLPGDSL